MKPVFQRKDGNCLRACVASILELYIKDVPKFTRSDDREDEAWFKRLVEFFEFYGYRAYWGPKWHWYDTGNYSIGYGYVDGKLNSPHAVVCMNGEIIHDPANQWLVKEIPYYINLEKI